MKWNIDVRLIIYSLRHQRCNSVHSDFKISLKDFLTFSASNLLEIVLSNIFVIGLIFWKLLICLFFFSVLLLQDPCHNLLHASIHIVKEVMDKRLEEWYSPYGFINRICNKKIRLRDKHSWEITDFPKFLYLHIGTSPSKPRRAYS